MTSLTLFPEDQADAEWTTRDPADIAGWLKRLDVEYRRVAEVPDGFKPAPAEETLEHQHDRESGHLLRSGIGAFHLHERGRVYLLLCEPGDLVTVPGRMRHWLDLGEGGAEVLVPEGEMGSVAAGGGEIVRRFPRLEAYRPALVAPQPPLFSRRPRMPVGTTRAA
jgi:hypothetical protein